MNQTTEEKKEALTKTLAIVGFLVIILFAVWLAVRIVTLIPSAFSSLASLADSVYNYNDTQELVVATPNTVVNAGESFTVTWTVLHKKGTYSFSYACTEGVAVDVKNITGEIISLPCNTELDLGEATSLEVLVASEKFRFVDVPYTISFTEQNKDESVSSTSKTITIVNATIPASANLVQDEVPAEETPTETTTETATPKPPVYTAGTPTTVKQYTYAVPVSDPKGTIDLSITYIGVGTLSGKTFTPKSKIETDQNGAIQFEIKNIGTKTAEDWSYVVHLPGDVTFNSSEQKALKPNERAVITVGFEGITKSGTEKFDVKVTAKNDVKKANDSFEASVKIVK
jgi:hypothetical protein